MKTRYVNIPRAAAETVRPEIRAAQEAPGFTAADFRLFCETPSAVCFRVTDRYAAELLGRLDRIAVGRGRRKGAARTAALAIRADLAAK